MQITSFIKQGARKIAEEKPDINEFVRQYFIEKGASEYYAAQEKMEKQAGLSRFMRKRILTNIGGTNGFN